MEFPVNTKTEYMCPICNAKSEPGQFQPFAPDNFELYRLRCPRCQQASKLGYWTKLQTILPQPRQ